MPSAREGTFTVAHGMLTSVTRIALPLLTAGVPGEAPGAGDTAPAPGSTAAGRLPRSDPDRNADLNLGLVPTLVAVAGDRVVRDDLLTHGCHLLRARRIRPRRGVRRGTPGPRPTGAGGHRRPGPRDRRRCG